MGRALKYLALGFVVLGVCSVRAATFTVTDPADAGAGTLRTALVSANADPLTLDTINFSISGQTLSPASAYSSVSKYDSLGLTINAPSGLVIDRAGLSIFTFQNASASGNATYTLNNDMSLNGIVTMGSHTTLAGSFILNGGSLEFGNATTLSAGVALQLGGGTIQVNSGATTNVSGSLIGSGSLTKTGAGTLTLTTANYYTGNTTINAGVLSINSASRLGSGSNLIFNGGTLQTTSSMTIFKTVKLPGAGTFDVTVGTTTLNSYIDGAGSLIKTGTGTLTLTQANYYNGETTINAGVLSINSATQLGFANVLNFNGGTLQTTSSMSFFKIVKFLGAGTFEVTDGATTLDGSISGVGSLTKTGAGTLTLAVSNSYTGNTTINAGVLSINEYNRLGSGSNLNFNGGTLQTTSSMAISKAIDLVGAGTFDVTAGTTVLSNLISGAGGLTKTGTGTLTLDAANSYLGNTTINAGVLSINAANRLGSGSSLILNGGTLQTTSSMAIAKAIDLVGEGTFEVTAGTTTLNGSITGAGSLTKTGAGTLTLTNYQLGNTTINAGVLSINAANLQGSGSNLILNGGTLQTIAPMSIFNTVNLLGAGTFDVASGTTTTLNGSISGTGGLTKTGAGTLTLTTTNSYTGNTTINAGVLSINSASRLGSGSNLIFNGGTLQTTSSMTIFKTVTLLGAGTFDIGAPTTLARYIDGAGSLIKTGTGTLTLAEANYYDGDTTINAGVLSISAANRLGSGSNLIFNGGTLQTTFSMTIFNTVNLLGAGTFDVTAETATLSNLISGSGSLTKTGSGTLTLTTTNSYTGNTTINAGVLSINAADRLGSGSNLIFNGGTLQTTSSMSIGKAINLPGAGTFDVTVGTTTLSNLISGAGSLTKTGSGTLTLTTANTYTGGTTINAGTLFLPGDQLLAATGAITLNGGFLDLNNHTQTASRLSGTGGTLGFGTLTLDQTGTSTFSGVVSNATLVFNGTVTGNLTLAGTSDNPFGILTVNGGTVTLAKENSALAHSVGNNGLALTINNGGTVKLAGAGGDQIYQNSDVIVNTGGTLDLNGRNEGFNNLTGSGTLTNSAAATTSTLTLGENNGAATFSGVMQADVGTLALTKTGSGTLTLNANQTYTGDTTINAGTLALQAGLYDRGNTAGALTVNSGGTLHLQASDLLGAGRSQSPARLTINAGGLVKNQSGAFNTLTGLTLNGGELRADGGADAGFPAYQLKGTVTVGGSVASSITTTGAAFSGITLGNNTDGGVTTFLVNDVTGNTAPDLTISAYLANGNAGSPTFATVASGIAKTGTGTLALTGNNTYTGSTTISGGTLKVNGSIASSSLTTVQSGGTLAGGGLVGAVNLESGGKISPGNSPGTLTTGAETWSGGAGYVWELNHASDAGGAKGVTYDWLNIDGSLDLAATSGNKFTIYVTSLTAGNTAGATPGFIDGVTYQWIIATASAGVSHFNFDKFAINTSDFFNDPANSGGFTITNVGNDIVLNYTAVPEPTPSAISLAALLALTLWRKARRAH